MNAPTSPLPASLLRAEAQDDDLDARILQAEQRLIAREENLRRRVGLLGAQLRGRIEPWRNKRMRAMAYAGAALGGLLLWTLWRGRGRPARAVAGSSGGGEARNAGPGFAASNLPWVRLIGLAWPLLPAGWRSRIDPAVMNFVMSLGLPLAEKLFQGTAGRAPAAPPLETVAGPVGPRQLTGVWYEVGRMPASRTPQRALRQALRDDGSLERLQRTVQADGSEHIERGTVLPVPGTGGVQLRATTWPGWLRGLPIAWHDEWVLHVDDDAGELVLGSPQRDRLRVLTRRREPSLDRLQALMQIARDRGYDVARVELPEAG